MPNDFSQMALLPVATTIMLGCRNTITVFPRVCKEIPDKGKCNDVSEALSVQKDKQKVAFHELK